MSIRPPAPSPDYQPQPLPSSGVKVTPNPNDDKVKIPKAQTGNLGVGRKATFPANIGKAFESIGNRLNSVKASMTRPFTGSKKPVMKNNENILTRASNVFKSFVKSYPSASPVPHNDETPRNIHLDSSPANEAPPPPQSPPIPTAPPPPPFSAPSDVPQSPPPIPTEAPPTPPLMDKSTIPQTPPPPPPPFSAPPTNAFSSSLPAGDYPPIPTNAPPLPTSLPPPTNAPLTDAPAQPNVHAAAENKTEELNKKIDKTKYKIAEIFKEIESIEETYSTGLGLTLEALSIIEKHQSFLEPELVKSIFLDLRNAQNASKAICDDLKAAKTKEDKIKILTNPKYKELYQLIMKALGHKETLDNLLASISSGEQQKIAASLEESGGRISLRTLPSFITQLVQRPSRGEILLGELIKANEGLKQLNHELSQKNNPVNTRGRPTSPIAALQTERRGKYNALTSADVLSDALSELDTMMKETLLTYNTQNALAKLPAETNSLKEKLNKLTTLNKYLTKNDNKLPKDFATLNTNIQDLLNLLNDCLEKAKILADKYEQNPNNVKEEKSAYETADLAYRAKYQRVNVELGRLKEAVNSAGPQKLIDQIDQYLGISHSLWERLTIFFTNKKEG